MSKKDRREYRRQKETERAAQPSILDQELLELMRRVRNFTHSAELGTSPRSVALATLQKSNDEVAGAITGDREFYFAKHHSIVQGPKS